MAAWPLLVAALACGGERGGGGPGGALPPEQPALAGAWRPLGLSGGGGLFSPAIDPRDPLRMIVSSDMGAWYLTADGGASWAIVPAAQLAGNIHCRPAFDPAEPGTILAPHGWGGREIRVTRDGGTTWRPLATLPAALEGELAIHPDAPRHVLAGAGGRVFRSDDGGRHFVACAGPEGRVLGFHFSRRAAGAPWFAATTTGVWRSADEGRTWQRLAVPGPAPNGFAAASRPGRGVLWVTQEGRPEAGAWFARARRHPGILRSTDDGATWTPAGTAGLNVDGAPRDRWALAPHVTYGWPAASGADPDTVYVFGTGSGVEPPHHPTVYRSTDAGRTWTAAFQADPRFERPNVAPDYTIAALGQFHPGVPHALAVAPGDAGRLLLVDAARAWVSADGGRRWSPAHARPGEPGPRGHRWACNGLVVTSTWDYAVDPHDPARHALLYADLGLALSADAGRTWSWWGGGERPPWQNTCYQLARDPDVAGRAWGAFSELHDIPNANVVLGRHRVEGRAGGIARTDDGGVNWETAGQGLPALPATSVVLDPASPASARVLWAGFFGGGVYRSDDGGRTWSESHRGLGANRRVARLVRHADGTLWALVTANRRGGVFRADGAGLWRSTDRGATWQAAGPAVLWPKDVAVDPRDGRHVLLGAADAGGAEQGGLYETRDGGRSWRRLARKGPEHFGGYFHPAHPGWIYMTLAEDAPDAGLWLSTDGGATFRPAPGFPVRNVQRVVVDPRDPERVFVTTFGGGAWEGPASW